MALFFIGLGVLLLTAAFILGILVFHPTVTSVIIGLTVPFIIFLLLRKKLEQILKTDESDMQEEKKNENLGSINLDKPGQFNNLVSNESPETVNQNRDKLKDFFKNKLSKPSDKLKQNDFSFLEKEDKPLFIFQQSATVQNKLYAGNIETINFSIPYPDPLFPFRVKAIRNIFKILFSAKIYKSNSV
ncbi:MAG: hypothetical protein ABIW38_01105 [Ferruginibacter sp.]